MSATSQAPPAVRNMAIRAAAERLGLKSAIARFFLFNAAAKHGVPVSEELVPSYGAVDVTEQQAQQPAQQQAQQPVQQPAPAGDRPAPTATASATVEGTPSRRDVALGALGVAAVVAAGFVGYFLNQSPPQRVQQQQQLQPTQKIYESPLQYLEDQGANVPWPTPKQHTKTKS